MSVRSCQWGLECHPGISTQWAVEARQCLQLEAAHRDPQWWGSVPQTPCPGGTSSSHDSLSLADALIQDPHSWSLVQTVVTLMTTSRPEWELERGSGGRSCPSRCRIV